MPTYKFLKKVHYILLSIFQVPFGLQYDNYKQFLPLFWRKTVYIVETKVRKSHTFVGSVHLELSVDIVTCCMMSDIVHDTLVVNPCPEIINKSYETSALNLNSKGLSTSIQRL